MAKLLDKDGLNHFWQKIKTLLSGKADKNHTHTNSVKIETSDGQHSVSLYARSDGVSSWVETGSLHSANHISSESGISTDGDITFRGALRTNKSSIDPDTGEVVEHQVSVEARMNEYYYYPTLYIDGCNMEVNGLITSVNIEADNCSTWEISIPVDDDNYTYIYGMRDDDNNPHLMVDGSSLNVSGEILEGGTYLKDKYAPKEALVTTDATVRGLLNDMDNKANTNHNHYLNDLNTPYSKAGLHYTEAPYISSARACRTFGLSADQIIIEQSTDGGVTWTTGINQSTKVAYTNAEKESFFNGSRSYSVGIPLKNGVRSTDCMIRITITGMKYSVPDGTAETAKYNYWNSNYIASTERYCTLDFGYFWLCSYTDKISIQHQVATGANPNNWVSNGELAQATGWSGGNYVQFGNGNTFGGGTSQTGTYWNHRFIFRTCASDGSFNDSKLSTSSNAYVQYIQEISCYGLNCYTPANEMMRHDRPYTVDTSGIVRFPKSVCSSGGFVMSGQSDAANKLLTADGWYKPVGTINQFKILTRKTATTNEAVDLSSYINNANYSELMIIVRTQATAAVTLGISNTTNATTSNFIASKSLSNGTSYTKIILNKTDEGYYAWDVNGSIGFSNDATYKYIRNYSTASNAVSSMSIVIHGR